MSDEEILKISYSKPHLFGILFDKYHKQFIKIAQKTLRSKEDAEDAVQETFVRIYKYGKKFPENGGKFRPWANTILKNCLADQINKYKKATFSLTDEIADTTPDLQDDNYENKSYIQFVLKKIGGTAAEIMNLRYVLGKSFKEISKTLNIKGSAARVRVYRSKKIFMQVYKQFYNNYER